MSDCRNSYGKDAGCSDPAPPVTHILRATAIVATSVSLCITIVLIIVVLHKRGMLCLRLRPRAPRIPPALYVWSAPATDNAVSEPAPPPESITPPRTGAKSCKKAKAPPEPVSCVIMAGDDRPTHLARALPRDEFVDVSLDGKLDELERGKRKAPLISSR